MEKMPKITPVNDRLLCKRIPADLVTAGGVLLPDTAREERPQFAKVISVGPGRWSDDGLASRIPCSAKAGDTIIFGKYSYSDIQMKGQEFMMLRDDEVWGTVEGLEIEEEDNAGR